MVRMLAAPALLLVAFAGVACALGRGAPTVRLALVKASILTGLLVVASVEVLSAWTAVAVVSIATFWILIAALAWAVALARWPSSSPLAPLAARRRALRSLPAGDRGAAVACGALVLLTFIVAVLAPSNSWDSISYHMPRVAHWLANRSVRHYPTAELAQLRMPPFGGYAVATIQSLAGSDVWANAVQWLGYAGAAVAASLAVQQLAGTPTAQILAALGVLTIPAAVLQASTTLTDLWPGYWLLAFACFAIRPRTRADAVWAGSSLGLALLAKPTALFFGAPLAVLYLFRAGAGERSRLPFAAFSGLVVASFAFAIMAPFTARSVRAFGTAAGVSDLFTETITPATVLSNGLRQIALHVPVAAYARGVQRLHAALGIDPEDPRTTWEGEGFAFATTKSFGLRPLRPLEEVAGNPLHLVLAMVLLVVGGWRWRRLGDGARLAAAIGLAALAGFLLRTAMMKWQAWGARFDLPGFCLAAVPVGVALASLGARMRAAASLALILGAAPALLVAARRPLVNCEALLAVPLPIWPAIAGLLGVAALWMRAPGRRSRLALVQPVLVAVACALLVPPALRLGAASQRTTYPGIPASILTADRTELLFRVDPDRLPPYRRAAALAEESGCEVIGLDLPPDGFEYLFWVVLGTNTGQGLPRLTSVGVENASRNFEPDAQSPCLVISTLAHSTLPSDRWVREVISSSPHVSVYRPGSG